MGRHLFESEIEFRCVSMQNSANEPAVGCFSSSAASKFGVTGKS